MAKFYDVSMPIHDGMLSWPSDPDVSLTPAKTIADKGSNVTNLVAGTHLGTHLDAPKHFFDEGAGVDAIPLEQLIGPAVVVDATWVSHDVLEVDDIADHVPAGTERIILKTTNTTNELLTKPFTEDYVALS